MDRKLFREAAQALFGKQHWIGPLARHLDVAEKSIERMAFGETRIPPGIVSDLVKMCETRSETLGDVLPRLREAEREAYKT